MKRLIATLLSATLVILSGGEGWAQVVGRVAAPAAPVAPGMGAAGAAPVLAPAPVSLSVAPLSSPRLSAPGLSVPVVSPALPKVSAMPSVAAPAAIAAPVAPVQAVPAAVAAPAAAEAPAIGGAAPATKAVPKTTPSRSFAAMLKSLSLPSLVSPSASSAGRQDAERDFARRVGGSAVTDGPAVAAAETLFQPRGAAGLVRLSGAMNAVAPETPGAAPKTSEAALPRDIARSPAPVRHRSAYFPIALAAASAAVLALMAGLPLAVDAVMSWFPSFSTMGDGLVGAPLPGAGVAAVLLGAAAVTAALTALYAAWDFALFTFAVARREPVSDAEFWAFMKKEIRRWNLHPSVAASLLGTGPGRGLLKAWRPTNRFESLSFGFTAGGSIWRRPELARSPWLFRWVLKHELSHYALDKGRGPPQGSGFLFRGWDFIISELQARVKEWRTAGSLSRLRIPVLERVLHDAQVSLDLGADYDALIIHPGTHETRNPQTFRELSGRRARVIALETGVPGAEPKAAAFVGSAVHRESDLAPRAEGLLQVLERKGYNERFRLVVYPQSFGVLPSGGTREGAKLDAALKQLDDLSLLRRKLAISGPAVFEDGTPEARRLEELAQQFGRRPKKGPNAGAIKTMLDDMFFKTARAGLADVQAAAVLERLYQSIDYKGTLLMPFAPGETGLDTVQRLVRYWQGSDGGSFQLSRVDLPEGGHVIVARKLEPRVDLWINPKAEGRVLGSVTRVFNHSRADQEAYLSEAGFDAQELTRFRNAGMRVKHVFGPEHGSRIYVSVKRSHAKALKRYGAEAGFRLDPSRAGYELHLRTSGPIQNVDKAWALGLDGSGGRIYDIDTGLDVDHPDFSDRAMKSVDFTNEGPEDWVGHGSHKAGISYANGAVYRGMAPKAEGRMGKVFSQSGVGASDGDIMAAAVDAMQWDADVVSLSLGSPGTVDSALAKFFSELSRRKNKRGHFPIVTASAGNAGPFNETRSQPSSGEFVTAVAAAAKSEDDGVPEISFYSSVGPALDKRWSRARWRRPYGLTALGGDVTTPPGVVDVYEHGIESVKSKDMPAGASDSADGKGTRMSGTSMSNPMVAAVALLVKQAALRVLTEGSPAHTFFMENLPRAATLILMRSSKDMGVPLFFQEGGFIDAEAAVQLAASSFGGDLLSWPRRLAQALTSVFRSSGASQPEGGAAPWDWMARAQAVWGLEDRPYVSAEAAKKEFLAAKALEARSGPTDAPSEDETHAEQIKGELGNQANAVFDRAFNSARAAAAGELAAALKDEVWLVRFYAAFALANHRTPEAAMALAEAAISDPEPRVRQAAFLALAETPSYAADDALRGALGDPRADVRMWGAYALARHGDSSGIDRLSAAATHQDKRVRMSAVWLLGRLGTRAPPAAADALTARAVGEGERGVVRHVAVASLAEIANAKPDSVTNETILGLLAASGPKNFALTRTISKFFSAVSRSSEARRRMGEEPLRGAIVAFINTYKAHANAEGALGQMIRLLARIVNVPIDLPTPLPDPNGTGVPGVDSLRGPVHLIVEMPESGARIARFQDFRGQVPGAALESASTFGLDTETLNRHDAALQAAMPVSQTVWMSVPAPKVMALRTELESRGFTVRRAGPMYRLLKETGPLSGLPEARESRALSGDGVLVVHLDEGGDTDHPAIPAARIAHRRNFIAEEGGPEDVQSESVSHGTHGMGIIGGKDDSPYTGMAPGVRFAVGKVLGAQGGSEATVMAGLEWAASLVADPLKEPVLVNLSLGGPGAPDSALGRLVDALRLRNITVVAAAGNEGPMEDTVSSPANAPLAISVGAVDKAKSLTDYSSRGRKGTALVSWLDFGGAVFFGLPNPYEIVSALNRRLSEAMAEEPVAVKWGGKALYHFMSGTSMAAPHTTGKLALLTERLLKAFREKGRGLPTGYAFYLEGVVERTAEAVPGGSEAVGAGLFDLAKALSVLDAELGDPDAVAASSEAAMRQAQEKHGARLAPPAPAGWLRRLTGTVFSSVWSTVWGSLTAFLR
ncbi:MAG: S8 family serine peptidase [Elusimicrobia bacterium]|nr:S8 family serine peptidase [Elusimicrobiota bacterium]